MAEVDIQEQLKDLIEGSTMNWTYAIVWLYSSDHRWRSAMKWHGGYCKLLGTGKKTKEVRIFGSSVTVTDEEVTDTEWFFNISMAQLFEDWPGREFFLRPCFKWLTGSEELLGSQWKRAKQAQEHGIQTLLLIPCATGVMELGSTLIIPFGVKVVEDITSSLTLIRRTGLRNTAIPESLAIYLQEIRRKHIRGDNQKQNRGQDSNSMHKQLLGKEKMSDSKCSWSLLTESSSRGTDRTFSYSTDYSGPSGVVLTLDLKL